MVFPTSLSLAGPVSASLWPPATDVALPVALLVSPPLIEPLAPFALLPLPPATASAKGVENVVQLLAYGLGPAPVRFEQPPRIEPYCSEASLKIPPPTEANTPAARLLSPPVTEA